MTLFSRTALVLTLACAMTVTGQQISIANDKTVTIAEKIAKPAKKPNPPAQKADTDNKPRQNVEISKKTLRSIGEMKVARAMADDSLLDIARRFNLGYIEITIANPHLNPWVVPQGTEVLLPTKYLLPDAPQEGIVINLAEMRLYYYPGRNQTPFTYPIGIGREGVQTPLGRTKVTNKKEGPWWTPTARMRQEDPTLPAVVKQRPEDKNPMGTHAVYLGWPSYAIHGTQEPWGIGRTTSAGCIRMYPEDIPRLFEKVEIGTPVTVIHQPIKLAWLDDGHLYMEAFPSKNQSFRLDQDEAFHFEIPQDFYEQIQKIAGAQQDHLDWPTIIQLLKRRPGYPVAISHTPRDKNVETRAEQNGQQPAAPASTDRPRRQLGYN